ncbi:MAG: hypothetical protein HYY49_11015 [Ignavibacteriales bacterium]|nr:hypothetical protein [Ignavibacteriales bacterium]
MRIILAVSLIVMASVSVFAQEKSEEKSSNLRQYYSGKFGFYQPSDGLNNGLLFGIDGVTEFINYKFTLTGAADLYMKQTIGIFKDPKPTVYQQQMVLIPLHANVGFKLFDVPDADSRAYAGAGGGYYLYFYAVEYASGSGGILGGGLSSQTETRNGGKAFGTVFLRLLIGQIFIEPRFYIAGKAEDTVPDNYTFLVNPSGFSITMGVQYR